MQVKPYQNKYNFVAAFKVSGVALIAKPGAEAKPSEPFDLNTGEGLIQFAGNLPYNFPTFDNEKQRKEKERAALPWVMKFLADTLNKETVTNPRLNIEFSTITATAY